MDLRQPVLRKVITYISLFTLRKVYTYYEEVVRRRSETYTNSFTKSSGLPYSYRIKARMDKALNTSRTLKIKDIHPY